MSCKAIVGKFSMSWARELTIELATLEVKEDKIEPISAENCSEANKDGKIDLSGVTKSTCWDAWNILNDCSINIGVKNQRGKTINIIRKNTTMAAERFFDFIFL